MGNLTIILEFLFMDIASSRELQILQSLIFLVIYLGAVAGNLLTVTVILTDTHLHSPMYFFIANLSLLDFCYISVTVPKSIVNSLMNKFFFLVVMSYDRYVAICHPLHYQLIITPRLCKQLSGGSWATGSEFFACLGPISNTSTIQSLFTAIFYSMASPLINPIIFSLRNREIKNALNRMFNTTSKVLLKAGHHFIILFFDSRENSVLMDMGNLTIIKEFLLMGITSTREQQVLQAVLFLAIYLATMTGNLLTVTVIVTDTQLHSPMYFFIGNLSLLDYCYISVTVPKSIVNSLMDSKLISLQECVAQTFLFILFGSTEFFFLVVMSYDRYVAICHPLHYQLIITPRLCTQMSGGSWATGLIYSAIHTGTIFRLPFTKSNVIHQFFCDIPQILSISSQSVQFSETVAIAGSTGVVLLCVVILFTSYVNIFSTVLQMRSVEARNKALSTCSPQIATIILFITSALFACFGPMSNTSTIQSLLMAVFYSM
ncbi:PREDICTED: olfactory receptor 14I1-like, partial [Chrysochloris asiatica]|uniref:Olfactory receptor 14I1-like n=1 Tax=Chrysochloris asiatica TaxID=185453 RepID=A0A9B0U7G8_CHRAS